MARLSSIDRMPPAMRELVGRLRQERGLTIDEILAHLRQLDVDVSRSALGRHVKWLDGAAEDLRRSRQVAEYLSRTADDAADANMARVNIEYMQNEVFDLLRKIRDAAREAEAEGADEELAAKAKALALIGRTLESTAKAARSNLDYVKAVEQRAAERAKAEAAVAVEKVAKARGLTADTLAAIKAGIFGVREEK